MMISVEKRGGLTCQRWKMKDNGDLLWLEYFSVFENVVAQVLILTVLNMACSLGRSTDEGQALAQSVLITSRNEFAQIPNERDESFSN